MNRNKNGSRPLDPYEEQYRQQLEQFSRLAGSDDDGEVDLSMGSIDDAFAGEYQRGSGEQPYSGQYASSRDGDIYRQGGNEPRRNVRSENGNVRRQREYGEAPQPRREQETGKRKAKPVNKTPSPKRDKKEGSVNSRPPKQRKSTHVRNEKHYNGEELQFGGHSGGNIPAHEKKHPVRTFFKTAFFVLFALFIGLNGLLYYYTGLVHRRGHGDRSFTSGSLKSSNVTNILMIGSDTRDENEYGRTDSMILMSINKTNKTVTMTSFMRDMYVEIKGKNTYGEEVDFWDKLNAAYVYGGAELLMDTLEYNFDISVDDYVYVDFFAFVDIVDSLGGIEVDVTDEEAWGMEDPMREQNRILGQPGSTDLLDHGGKLNLNGNQALAYARLRYVGNADFQRTERQREVIGKIIDKAKRSDPLTLNRFAKAVCSNLSTNMSRADMMLAAYKVVFSLNYEMRSLRLPAEGDYGYGIHGDQSTLDVDLDACRELLRKELYYNT